MTTPSRTARRGGVPRNVGWLTATAMLAFAALAPVAHAASVTPTPINSGNPTCASFNPSWTQFKLEGSALANGTYTDGTLQVTISGYTGSVSGTPGRFDWTSNMGVDAVFVKAGSIRHNLFVYVPESTADSGLGPQAGIGNGISHISFCYDVALATDVPTNAVTDSPSSAATDSPSSAATDSPSSAATDSPSSAATDSPSSAATDSPSSAATDSPSSAATDVPMSQITDSPLSASTDSPADQPAGRVTNAPTDSPADPPASHTTDSSTQAPTGQNLSGSRPAGAARPVPTDALAGDVAGITGVPGMTPPPTDTMVPVQVPTGDGWLPGLIGLAAILIGGFASRQARRVGRDRQL